MNDIFRYAIGAIVLISVSLAPSSCSDTAAAEYQAAEMHENFDYATEEEVVAFPAEDEVSDATPVVVVSDELPEASSN